MSYFDLGGTVRSQTAEQTLIWLKPFLKELGITRVANVTGLDCLGIPVAISIRPNSKHLTTSQGKGITWELAAASAIMESIEGYHVENPPPPVLQGSYNELHSAYPLINPLSLTPGIFTLRHLADQPMGWVEAVNIGTSPPSTMFIPHILTCLDSTQPHPEYSFLSVSSNGLAAGNQKEEAICHAIYEIIERDSLCCWGSLNDDERAATQLRLDTIDSSLNKNLLQQFTAANQLIKIWNITSRLGIPTFHCVIYDANPARSLGVFRGTGSHICKEIALSRTLTEVAQSRLTLISGSRDDVFNDHYQQRASFTYNKIDYQGQFDYQSLLPIINPTSFDQTIDFLCAQLNEHGYKHILVFDHTKPEFNIPVVQVFIPGMLFNGSRI